MAHDDVKRSLLLIESCSCEQKDEQLDELSPDVYRRAAAGRQAQAEKFGQSFRKDDAAKFDKRADKLNWAADRRELDALANEPLSTLSPATKRKMGLKTRFTKANNTQVFKEDEFDAFLESMREMAGMPLNELGDTWAGRMKLRALARRAGKPDSLAKDVGNRFNDTDDRGFSRDYDATAAQFRDSGERLSNVANAARERIANKGTDTAAIRARNRQADYDQRKYDTSHSQFMRDRLQIDDPDYNTERFAKVKSTRPGQYGVSQRNTFRGDVPPVKEGEDYGLEEMRSTPKDKGSGQETYPGKTAKPGIGQWGGTEPKPKTTSKKPGDGIHQPTVGEPKVFESQTAEDAEFQSFMETLNYVMKHK